MARVLGLRLALLDLRAAALPGRGKGRRPDGGHHRLVAIHVHRDNGVAGINGALEGALANHVLNIRHLSDERTFKRPMYAGTANVTVPEDSDQPRAEGPTAE